MASAAAKWLKWSDMRSVLVALLISSFLFSAIHYVGEMADPFTVFSFVYRFLAGMLFAGLYAARSFAVAVWTHALYDVLVLVF
jgi:membrane protease YdiL (CAAX protease family)